MIFPDKTVRAALFVGMDRATIVSILTQGNPVYYKKKQNKLPSETRGEYEVLATAIFWQWIVLKSEPIRPFFNYLLDQGAQETDRRDLYRTISQAALDKKAAKKLKQILIRGLKQCQPEAFQQYLF